MVEEPSGLETHEKGVSAHRERRTHAMESTVFLSGYAIARKSRRYCDIKGGKYTRKMAQGTVTCDTDLPRKSGGMKNGRSPRALVTALTSIFAEGIHQFDVTYPPCKCTVRRLHRFKQCNWRWLRGSFAREPNEPRPKHPKICNLNGLSWYADDFKEHKTGQVHVCPRKITHDPDSPLNCTVCSSCESKRRFN